jgi:hypothetical protein
VVTVVPFRANTSPDPCVDNSLFHPAASHSGVDDFLPLSAWVTNLSQFFSLPIRGALLDPIRKIVSPTTNAYTQRSNRVVPQFEIEGYGGKSREMAE